MAITKGWQGFISAQQKYDYFQKLTQEIAAQREQGIEIYPQDSKIYSAFNFVDIADVKVVILGQDPYHGPNQAQGLAFSVNQDVKVPPSLVNIYKELADDIAGFKIPEHGDLSTWAKQGVLLLNTVLTVQRAKAHSHAKLGWEEFSAAVISVINEQNPHCVFLLWGAHAQQKGRGIDREKHLVLESVHPSPLSAYRGFLGCKHFSQTNDWLIKHHKTPINWQLQTLGSLDLF
ncbi:MAG: uracil-DNA glycosylase [Oceanospirillaceae bacterium]